MPEPKRRRGESVVAAEALPMASAPLVLTPYPAALAAGSAAAAAALAGAGPPDVDLHIRAPAAGAPVDLMGSFDRDYELGEELGRGAMSIVRRARERSTGVWRAVKIVDTARFRLVPGYTAAHALSEVRILRELDHPNIIRVFGAYEGLYLGKSALFIVTELAAGGELFNSLVRAGNFSEPQARHVMWQALRALAYLHAANIIHRDLKPENLLVVSTTAVSEEDPVVRPSAAGTASPHDGPDGAVMIPMLNIKVADFGTARYLGDISATTFVGSPQYVAPEVLFARDSLRGGDAGGAGYGRPVDVYSLGVVLYVCLAGYLPFDAGAPTPPGVASDDDMATWELRARAGNFHFAPPVWTHISGEAKALIRGMMARNPAKRLTVAEALAHPWFAPQRAAEAEAAAAAAGAAVRIAPLMPGLGAAAVAAPPPAAALPSPASPPAAAVDTAARGAGQYASLSAATPDAFRRQQAAAAAHGSRYDRAASSAALAAAVAGEQAQTASRLLIESGLSRLGINGSTTPTPPPQAGTPAAGARPAATPMAAAAAPTPVTHLFPPTSASSVGPLSAADASRNDLALSIELHEAAHAASQRGLLAQIAAATLIRDANSAAALLREQSSPLLPPHTAINAEARQDRSGGGGRWRSSREPAAASAGAAAPPSTAPPLTSSLLAVLDSGGGSGGGDASQAAASAVGGAGGGDWQLHVLGTVARSLDFARLLAAQAAAASTFEAAYLAVRDHPPAADVVRRHAVAARELQWGVAQTVGECRVLADAIVGILPDMRESVLEGDAPLTSGIFARLLGWVRELKEAAGRMQTAYAALVRAVQLSVEQARSLQLDEHNHDDNHRHFGEVSPTVNRYGGDSSPGVGGRAGGAAEGGEHGAVAAVDVGAAWGRAVSFEADAAASAAASGVPRPASSWLLQPAQPGRTPSSDADSAVPPIPAVSPPTAIRPAPSSTASNPVTSPGLPPLHPGSPSTAAKFVGSSSAAAALRSASAAHGGETVDAAMATLFSGNVLPPAPARGDNAGDPSASSQHDRDMLDLFLYTPGVVVDDARLQRLLSSMGETPPSARSTQVPSPGVMPRVPSSGDVQMSTSTSAPRPALQPVRPPPMQTVDSHASSSPSESSSGVVSEAHAEPRVRQRKCLGCALVELRRADRVLTEAVDFWSSMELVIDVIVRRKEHSESLLRHATTPRLVAKATTSLADYAAFWSAFGLLCTHYSRALRTSTDESYMWLRASDDQLDAREQALLVRARGSLLT